MSWQKTAHHIGEEIPHNKASNSNKNVANRQNLTAFRHGRQQTVLDVLRVWNRLFQFRFHRLPRIVSGRLMAATVDGNEHTHTC